MGMILIVAGVIVVGFIVIYNGLINKKNQVNNSFSSIDVLMKKRFDLIPNLIAAVQNYMQHEKQVLEEVTRMRSEAISGNLSDKEKIALDKKVTGALSGIMVAVEQYPDLKANQNFMQLQAALNEVEEQLSAARRAYNATVTDYNNALEMFPSNVIANTMKLEKRDWFEAPEENRENVDVNALFDKK